mmetsp:Transcript_40026/g.39626  ORF Transcript_40026/g.39626 Transcript_40026/m.39626 type:complete len:155 (-) Transcript_40026:34-498(-)
MKGGSEELVRKAGEIVSKWKRLWADEMASGISQEERYRDFKRRKQYEAEYHGARADKKFKTNEEDSGEDENEEEKDTKSKKKKKKEEGFLIPQKNQFDFTFKPTSNVIKKDLRVKPDSVRGQFIRASLKMKKDFTSQQKATFAAIKPNLNPDKD